MPVTPEQLQRIVNAQEWDPFSVLGPHRESSGNTEHIRIRAFLPDAAEVACLPHQHTTRFEKIINFRLPHKFMTFGIAIAALSIIMMFIRAFVMD